MVLNWNGWKQTKTCLESLAAAKVRDVWLVDNGSQQNRSAEILAIYPYTRMLLLGDNYGWAGAYNRALKVAAKEGHDFAYLLNNDCVVTPLFLCAALEIMRADPHCGAVGSVMLYEGEKRLVRFDGKYYAPGEKEFTQIGNAAKHVDEANGAGILIRLQAFQDARFEERFFCYREETEWCYRVRRRGWNIALAPNSLVFHEGGSSDMNGNASYYRTRNYFLLKERISISFGWSEKLKIAFGIIADAAKYVNDDTRAEIYTALVQALHDGLFQIWGKRKGEHSSPVWRMTTWLCCRAYRLSRRRY